MPLRSPPLGETLDAWLTRLDAEGFQVGLRERLIVQTFLTRLAARGELPESPDSREAALRLIGPLICTTPESQRHYAALLKTFLAVRPRRFRRGRAGVAAPRDAAAPVRRRGWWIGLAMLVAAIVVGLGWWVSQRPEPPETLPPPPEAALDVPMADARALDIYAPPPAAPEPIALEAMPRPLRDAARLVAGLSALLLAWAAWARMRRALYLHGTRTDAEVEEHVLGNPDGTPHGDRLEPEAGPIRVASRGLRQRVAGEREVLDLNATLAATIDAGGAFSPRYRLLRHTPEYLALIDQRHPGDHLAAYAEAVLDALAAHGVTLHVYHFEGTPDLGCWRSRPGQTGRAVFDRASFAELVARYGGYRLLVFADTAALADPISGGCRPWAGQLGGFRQRAWFTPMPMASWGDAEALADAQGFLVLPMPAEALTTLAGWFSSGDLSLAAGADWPLAYPALLRDQGVAWVARQQPPPEAMLQELLFQLRAYLGAQRYQWLCACAIFPALSPTLTLALGRALSGEARELALGIASLGALPWFRHGRMPAWLRQALLAGLSPENEARYRAIIETRLAGALENTPGVELARVATRKKLFAWLDRGRGPARDVVLVDFLRQDRLLRLVQKLPEPLRRRLFHNGLAAWGLRPELLLGLAGALGLALGVLYFAPRFWAQPAMDVAKPRIEFIGCVDPLGVDLGTRALVDALARVAPADLGLANRAASFDLAAYAPAAWTAQGGRPAPLAGDILHAQGNAEQLALAERLRRWLAASAPGGPTRAWNVREAAGLAAVTVNACAAAPVVAPPIQDAVAATATVYIQIGDKAQAAWAEALAEQLRGLGFTVPAIEQVDAGRLPKRIEVRAQKSGDTQVAERIAAVLAGALQTPAALNGIQTPRDARLDGNVYEVWASASLCIQDRAPSCGAAPVSVRPVVIRAFSAAPASIDPGEPARLCYVVENALKLSITPAVGALKSTDKGCVAVTPAGTTRYTLAAQGEGRATARRGVTVQVRAVTKVDPAPEPSGKAAAEAAPPASRGWCCVIPQARQQVQQQQIAASPQLFPADLKECLSRDGRYFADQGGAEAACATRPEQNARTPELPTAWRDVNVAEIQGLLAKAGYYKGAGDGVVGDALIKALMLFQESNKMVPDGIPGPRTLSLLRGERAAPNPPVRLPLKR
jgi:hypothetical protein